MTTAPTKYDDVIDSRDIIERLEELQAEDSLTDNEKQELIVLSTFADAASGYSEDWAYGATLIRESYFTRYCEELLEDIGDLPKDLPFYIVIDWEATARNLKVDYTSVEFDGVEYLVR